MLTSRLNSVSLEMLCPEMRETRSYLALLISVIWKVSSKRVGSDVAIVLLGSFVAVFLTGRCEVIYVGW